MQDRFSETAAMFETAQKTAIKYLTYYVEGIAYWWDHITPWEYLAILIAALGLGYVLLRSRPMHMH